MSKETEETLSARNERDRAKWAILANPGKPIAKVMSTYMVRPEIAQEFINGLHDLPVVTTDGDEAVKQRAVKWDTFYDWLDKHVGETFSPKQIGRATGFSTSTVRKFLRKNPERFLLATKARWTIVDPNGNAKPKKAQPAKKSAPTKKSQPVKKAASSKSVKKAAPRKAPAKRGTSK